MEYVRSGAEKRYAGRAGELLKPAGYIANLLEAGEHLPIHYPSTVPITAYCRQKNHIIGRATTGNRIYN